MSSPTIITADGVSLHWEHGYRCHGLWTADNRRVGVVGIGARGVWTKKDGYRWQLDAPRKAGSAPSLGRAQRRVEAYARRLTVGPKTPLGAGAKLAEFQVPEGGTPEWFAIIHGRGTCPECGARGLGDAKHPHAFGHHDPTRLSCRYCKADIKKPS